MFAGAGPRTGKDKALTTGQGVTRNSPAQAITIDVVVSEFLTEPGSQKTEMSGG